jgi:hypothetical protein
MRTLPESSVTSSLIVAAYIRVPPVVSASALIAVSVLTVTSVPLGILALRCAINIEPLPRAIRRTASENCFNMASLCNVAHESKERRNSMAARLPRYDTPLAGERAQWLI